ncbi:MULTISPECIES: hypothetical protein [unclassified Luteimonas]|uniref:hypothetical protein n=1 Tax=unclassified Luteimonas TaxID=2629088 RepID=UPI00160390D8|nr:MULTISPECIES: hypothetical protein [unclassified Luteimonas]MBB1473175.1 hypothetical protein [Luteimonas sp. MC1782]MBB6598121.1 hypothetical protein [Luteimonas sp. MC1825]QOC88355.1 hypothetical protein IDM46_00820 [Luteimonas sp. MC1825]
MNEITPPVHGQRRVLGALALELAYGAGVAHDSVAQEQAGKLAALVAADLAAFAPDAALLDCTLVAAHYDPVELLRPGWPLHQELWQLAARAPRAAGGGARVIAFGHHAGQLPGALSPSADFGGGPLRLLPFVLDGDPAVVARVAARCEADLMEEGMAGAATALAMQEAFGLRVEHARYLTVHDLCAMTALQYGHAGLEPLWPLLETALLSPAREAWLDAPPEPLLRYADGEVRMALLSPDAWRARYATGAVEAADEADDVRHARLARGFAHFEARQRQFASVLRAHGITVSFAHASGDPHDAL